MDASGCIHVGFSLYLLKAIWNTKCTNVNTRRLASPEISKVYTCMFRPEKGPMRTLYKHISPKLIVTSKQFLWSSFTLSSRVDWCSACERRKLLMAARHVVLALKARCRAVEVLLACSIPLFMVEFVFTRNLFVTAWSWYGHFSKSLFSSNLWLVVIRLAVLYRHRSVNVSLQGNTTAFWDWSQVFGDRTFWVPGLYRTLSQ